MKCTYLYMDICAAGCNCHHAYYIPVCMSYVMKYTYMYMLIALNMKLSCYKRKIRIFQSFVIKSLRFEIFSIYLAQAHIIVSDPLVIQNILILMFRQLIATGALFSVKSSLFVFIVLISNILLKDCALHELVLCLIWFKPQVWLLIF